MRLKSLMTLLFALTLSLAACGGDSGSSNNGDRDQSAITDRGGPDSLTGFEWTSEPTDVNGVELQLSFEFTEDEVIASNTCNGATTVTTSSPISYQYTGQIAQGDSATESEGDSFCEVEIKPSEFTFEIVGDNLQIDDGNETVVAAPAGSANGLYGSWKIETEVGTLTFRMGNGKLVAENACNNGITAEVSVDASYQNLLVIEEESSAEKDGCTVAISSGTYEYRFDSQDLVLEQGGQEIRFEKR